MSDPTSSTSQRWRDLIQRREASGLSVAAFCRREGLAESSFFLWKRKLGAAVAALGFVEARVVDSPASPTWIEVRLRGGRRVRVGRGFDQGLLVEVVAALEGMA